MWWFETKVKSFLVPQTPQRERVSTAARPSFLTFRGGGAWSPHELRTPSAPCCRQEEELPPAFVLCGLSERGEQAQHAGGDRNARIFFEGKIGGKSWCDACDRTREDRESQREMPDGPRRSAERCASTRAERAARPRTRASTARACGQRRGVGWRGRR